MRIRPTKLILLILLGLSNSYAIAESPEKLLGKPYTYASVYKYIQNLKNNSPVESFLPYLRILKLDYLKSGVSMEFNTDIVLSKISLFDSGYSYEKYVGKMPFNVSWGMSVDQIQDKAGGLDFVSDNKYVRRMSTDDFQMDFYFENSKLYHIRILATLKTLQNFPNEIMEATGIRLIPDGKKIDGNIIDGQGSMIWGDGVAVYKGEWTYGVPHGEGQYIDSFGNKYEGNFKLGFFWGQGKFYSKYYKYSYSGSFAMSKKHGEGRIGYSNRTSYQGEWKQNKMEGQGTYSISNRYSYKGRMVNNTFNGRGILKTPDGVIDGYFKNGKPHGKCTQSSSDGAQLITGKFINGKKNGDFDVTILGNKSTITYKDDIEIKQIPVDGSLIDK
tara:strand:+ start:535 stop:1692 length:1158 start_codon:yes stop_codon:yes gene_type:complete